MKKSIFTWVVFSLIAALALTACSGQETAAPTQPPAASNTIPGEYAEMNNPFAGDAAAAAVGAQLYQEKCSSCHGASGMGDGAAGTALDPKPSNLVETAQSQEADYIYWRIETGSASGPANSLMPPWKDLLSTDEIWQVVTYIESLE